MKKSVLCILLVFIISTAMLANEIINLDSGPISGMQKNGLKIYLGIPYAAPPIGKLRWQAPKAVKPWKKVKSCIAFSASCPQSKGENVGKTSEDCLYLNVWTPAKKANEKFAVMVWIHGGGWSCGSASSTGDGGSDIFGYNGAKLAKKGVVFVSFNYRLGPFGFFAHPQLALESSRGTMGNYGFMDQIALLKWVKRNISKFGGDPNNVTIFGESAGSAAVSLHMISPYSQGLFHRGISESGGPCGLEYIMKQADYQMQNAIIDSQKLVKALKCDQTKDPIKAMRAKSSTEIIKAYPFSLAPFSSGLKFGPVADGDIIPDNPQKLYQMGKSFDLPLIIGSNADEGNLFYQAMSVAKYKDWLKLNFGQHADEVFSMFPAAKDEDVRLAFDRLISVAAFTEPARFVARSRDGRKAKTYLYHFTRVIPTDFGRLVGAGHAMDIFYVFGIVDTKKGFPEADVELSNKMMDYWVNFAKTGDPNSPGLPLWLAYETKTDQNIEFGDTIKINKHLLKKECDFIQRINF
ncbi:MAG: carboxylesterase/lipase family protein [Candidatus Margulisiibacteriota bacterium]|jgi:para-nitrobenzyl esterase